MALQLSNSLHRKIGLPLLAGIALTGLVGCQQSLTLPFLPKSAPTTVSAEEEISDPAASETPPEVQTSAVDNTSTSAPSNSALGGAPLGNSTLGNSATVVTAPGEPATTSIQPQTVAPIQPQDETQDGMAETVLGPAIRAKAGRPIGQQLNERGIKLKGL